MMKCPYCKNEMQKGYIQCRDGLYWTPRKQWAPALAFLAKGAVPIGTDDGLTAKTKAIAYHCPDCKTVMIPYENET